MIKLCSSKLSIVAISIVTCTSLLTAKEITNTIIVRKGDTYDGNGETITAKDMGDGGQSENQKPVFKLEHGAILKNVIIGKPGCDGIHCYGNNYLENITWEDIGEDALTVKSSWSINDYVYIKGGSAKDGADKCFQINDEITFRIENFTASNVGKFVRQNGGTGFKAIIQIVNCDVSAKLNIVRSESSLSDLYYCNSTFSSTSDKQFDIKTVHIDDCGNDINIGQSDVFTSEIVQSKNLAVSFRHLTKTLRLTKPATDLVVELISLNGSQLTSKKITTSGAQTEYTLPLRKIQNGCYILKTTVDGIVSTQNVSIY